MFLLAVALAISVVAAFALERTRADFALLAAYIAGFVLFAVLRTAADDTGVCVKGQYVVDIE